MTVVVTSPITGAAQTGFTSPTYTVVSDLAPTNNGKQYAVTAIGGTQTGVTIHSATNPFTIAAFRPAVFKQIGQPNPVTGVISSIPNNVTKVITRKGVTPAANQSPRPFVIRSEFDLPAGADTYDPANVRAAISAHIGALTQIAAGLGDTVVSGVLG
jgi:hypothetical protein